MFVHQSVLSFVIAFAPPTASVPEPVPPPDFGAAPSEGEAAPSPEPTEPAPATSATEVAGDRSASQFDPVAAARITGNELVAAGAYFWMYGATVTAMSAMYSPQGFNAPGVAVGLAVGGLVNLSIGLGLVVPGVARSRADDAWLDAKPGRRARFERKAANRGLYLRTGEMTDSQREQSTRGRTLNRAGLITIISGGLITGIGAGIAPSSRPRAWA